MGHAMTSDVNMICWIRRKIADQGKLINKAQSCWGMDRWEYNGIGVGLGDDGYTDFVFWGDRLRCNHTHGHDTIYDYGTYEDLLTLYTGLGGEV